MSGITDPGRLSSRVSQSRLALLGCRGPSSTVLNRLHKGETLQDVFMGMVKARSKASEEAVSPVLRLLRTRTNNALSFQPNLGNEKSRIR